MHDPGISIRHGITWIGVSQVSKIGLQLVAIVTLARILPPSDYGLIALATVVTGFAAMFRDMGTGASLIHKKCINLALTSTIFWFNVVLGFTLTAIIFCLAPLISDVFGAPKLRHILLILSPVFFISSLGIVHQALFERDSKFKTIAIIDIISSVLALCGALLIAFKGGGVYALVAHSLITAIVSSVSLWVVSRWRPIFRASFVELKEVWSYSGNIFSFNFVNYFHRNTDSMLIGRFVGAVDLGFYNIAYRLILFPLQNITFVVNRASFPAYSRSNSDKRKIGLHYLATLEIIAFITAPMMAMLWALREPFVLVVLGEKWLPSAGVIAWLAAVGFFQSLVSTSGSVLNAIGRSDILRNLGFIGVPFLTSSFFIGLPWGIEGVAAAYSIANFFWVYPVMRTVFKQLSMPFMDFVKVVVKPMLLALFIAIFVRFGGDLLFTYKVSEVYQLLLGLSVGIVGYIASSNFLMKTTLRRFISLLRRNEDYS